MAEWIMVLITLIYVVATIFICIFNYRSVEVTREQIKLSKMQYEDDIRLRIMPCLFVEKIDSTKFFNGIIEYDFQTCCNESEPIVQGELYLKIRNVGSGIAKDVGYWIYPCISRYQRYYIVSFSVGDCRTVKWLFSGKNGMRQRLDIEIHYLDLLDYKYIQTLSIFIKFLNDEVLLETFYISAPLYKKDGMIE